MNKIEYNILSMIMPTAFSYYPISAPNIHSLLKGRGFNVSLYKVRKILNKWRDKGFIAMRTFTIHSEYEIYPPMKGWQLKRDNDIYKYFDRRNARIMEEVCGD